MRKFGLASLILTTFLLTSISFAQECDSTCCDKTENQIQFHLVNDYSVSYLKMLTPSSGLRFKIDLGLSGSSGDKDGSYSNFHTVNMYSQVDASKSVDEFSNCNQYVNLVLNYMMSIRVADGVKCYLGTGPLLSFSNNSSTSNRKTVITQPSKTDNLITVLKNSEHSFGLGLQAVFGVEVMVTHRVFFLAEFNLNGTYSWNMYSELYEHFAGSLSKQEIEYDGTSWNYGLNQLKLGIAYRF